MEEEKTSFWRKLFSKKTPIGSKYQQLLSIDENKEQQENKVMIQDSSVNNDILNNTNSHNIYYKFDDWVTLTKLEEDSQPSVSTQDSSSSNNFKYILSDYLKEEKFNERYKYLKKEEFDKFLIEVREFYCKLDKLIKLEKQYNLTKKDIQQIEKTKKYLVDNINCIAEKLQIEMDTVRVNKKQRNIMREFYESRENKESLCCYDNTMLFNDKIVLQMGINSNIMELASIVNDNFIKTCIREDIELPKLEKEERESAKQDVNNNDINKAVENMNSFYSGYLELLREMDNGIQSINKTNQEQNSLVQN